MTPISNEDKETIKQLYFRDMHSLGYIQRLFNNKYEYAQIRSCVFRMIDEFGEQNGFTK